MTTTQQEPRPMPDNGLNHEDTADLERLRQVTDLTTDMGAQAQAVEAQEFIDSGYIDSQEDLAEEYAPYYDATTFMVIEKGAEVAGALRIIGNNPSGFKTFNDAVSGRLDTTPEGRQLIEQTDMDRTAEVGTIAVKKEYRGTDDGRASVKLYGAVISYCLEHDVDTIIASMDEPYYRSFKIVLGDAMHELGPATDYMGSPTVPILMNRVDMLEQLLLNAPGMYDEVEKASKSVV